jgi:hypothetical protein
MTEERMALAELLQKSGDGDFRRTVPEAVLQILMEADVEGLIGAGRHERTVDRQGTPTVASSPSSTADRGSSSRAAGRSGTLRFHASTEAGDCR